MYSVSQTVAGITFAQNFSDRFSAGITAKGVFDNLGEASGSAFAVDFGTNFHAQLSGHPIRFSFVVSNLGTNLSYSGSALETDAPAGLHPGRGTGPAEPAAVRVQDQGLPAPHHLPGGSGLRSDCRATTIA